jgi:8-oxo-dGTP diphosphatase
VGVLVIKDDRLLLVERAVDPFKGWWDIPGGFLQNGEHPEAGARREVQEETGLTIRLTGFVGIFMDTYETTGEHTLNIFYIGEPIGGTEMAASDAVGLQWFPLGHLPDQIAFACCRQAIATYVAQRAHREGTG